MADLESVIWLPCGMGCCTLSSISTLLASNFSLNTFGLSWSWATCLTVACKVPPAGISFSLFPVRVFPEESIRVSDCGVIVFINKHFLCEI